MTTEERIIKVLKQNIKDLTLDETRFSKVKFSDLGINSLNFIKIIVDLEDEFGIEFDDDQINYDLLNDMGAMVALIEQMTEG